MKKEEVGESVRGPFLPGMENSKCFLLCEKMRQQNNRVFIVVFKMNEALKECKLLFPHTTLPKVCWAPRWDLILSWFQSSFVPKHEYIP